MGRTSRRITLRNRFHNTEAVFEPRNRRGGCITIAAPTWRALCKKLCGVGGCLCLSRETLTIEGLDEGEGLVVLDAIGAVAIRLRG